MIHNCFPTPIFSFSLPNPNNSKYLEYAKDLMQTDKGQNRSNVYSWHSSPEKHPLNDKKLEDLSKFICDSAKKVIAQMGYDKIKLALQESWFIISPKGAYNKQHTHPGGFISGSYYIGGVSSPIVFYDPRVIKNFTEPKGMSNKTAYNVSNISMFPKEGDLIIFPSWLEHSVPENNSENERVILSFNFNLVR